VEALRASTDGVNQALFKVRTLIHDPGTAWIDQGPAILRCGVICSLQALEMLRLRARLLLFYHGRHLFSQSPCPDLAAFLALTYDATPVRHTAADTVGGIKI